MTTVPHPVPSRMAQNVAALYGHADDTLVAWQRACVQAAEALRPQHESERLSKALALAQDGAVVLEDDGSATVQGSGAQPYTVHGTLCDCPEAQKRGQPCKHALAVQIHQQAAALLVPSTAPAPAEEPPARLQPTPKARQPRPRSSAAWDVHEAPTSSCFKVRSGAFEWTHTVRASDDAEMMARLQAFLPTFREIAAALDAMHAAREAAKAAPAPPAPQPAPAPADLPALIQHAVQQALAAAAANGQAPSPPPAAPPSAPVPDDQQTGFCSIHQVAMEQKHNDRGTFYGHWLATEQRHCNGRRNGHR